MESRNVNLLLGKLCVGIGKGFDLSTGQTHSCTTNIIRVATSEDSYIKSNVFNEDTVGILIPSGATEYFEVNIGDVITVISGKINISSVK